MVSRKACRVLINMVILALSIAVMITIFWSISWTNQHCLPYMGSDKQKVVMMILYALGIALLCLSGLFYNLRNYPKMYISAIRSIVTLVFGLFVITILFRSLFSPSEHEWEKNHVTGDMWSPVKQCMVEAKFCNSFSALDGCCKKPTECKINETMSNPDCLVWETKNYVMCYSCNACKFGLLTEMKIDGQRVQCALIIFTTLMALVTILGVVEIFKRDLVEPNQPTMQVEL
ncbi:hypothetical protein ACH5RR_003642 [Cinchona calisaya]|uniref:Uncharacterized protein n=1 Tax=Cinchona calisaya TaxID=153742 RepID=A0ABD3AVE4_9GENT